MNQLTPECQKIQQWLFEMQFGGHKTEVARHLAGCPCCAAIHEEIHAAGELLAAVAQSAENQFPTSLSPQLRERVRAESQARLARKRTVGEGSEAPSATFPGGTVLRVPTPKRERRGFMPIHWAMAAMLTAVMAGLAIYGTLATQNFARLNFADGKVKITRGATETVYVGLQKQAPLARAAVLETESDSRALFMVGPAYVAVAQDSKVIVEGPDSLRVVRGEIWLQVSPAKNGFWVHTEDGAVRVTGTVFGVAARTGTTHVQVTEGTVVVSNGEGEAQVTEGQEVRANAAGVSAPAPRPGGATHPVWIDQLNEKSAKADDVQFLPTIAGDGK